MGKQTWVGPTGAVARAVVEQSERCLRSYMENPKLVSQDASIEITTATGGYGRKQLFELVQNGADALRGRRGRIELVLTDEALYCANEGRSLDVAGVETLLLSHDSAKRGDEIGRFGLGFKSVVGLTHSPQFFSRSGSFGWDRDTARARISAALGSEIDRWPTLRVATPLPPGDCAAADPVLGNLMSWASSVIKLPRDSENTGWLSRSLTEFRPEFLLFSPQVSELVLRDDTREGWERRMSIRADAGVHTLSVGTATSAWRIFTASHRPSVRAAKDAGELAQREEVPLTWAVPLQARGTGEFWAFFPTSRTTTLRGILNAPWKTNEDRSDLIEGAFNAELITDVATPLIADALEALVVPDDPGVVLDLLPARGRENRSWGDETLNRPLYSRLKQMPSLPDQHGVLRVPSSLEVPPLVAQPDWLAAWESYPDRPNNWVHRSAFTTPDRRSRVERLHDARPASFMVWMAALTKDGSPAASAAALRLAALVTRSDAVTATELAGVPVLLTESGRWVAPRPGAAFMRDPADETDPAAEYVHSEVLAETGALEALQQLGIGRVDAQGLLQAMLVTSPEAWPVQRWHDFWTHTRRLAPEAAAALITDKLGDAPSETVRIRTMAGAWEPLAQCLLPGLVVPADGSRDQPVAVDTDFHRADLALLELLGAREQPGPGSSDPVYASWRDAYVREMQLQHLAVLPAGTRRVKSDLVQVDGPRPPGPLGAMARLSPAGRLAMTAAVLRVETGRPWSSWHGSRNTRPPRACPPPAIWLLLTFGLVQTSHGPTPIGRCLHPALAQHQDVLPVLPQAPALMRHMHFPRELVEIPADTWRDILGAAETWVDDARIGKLLSLAVQYADVPPAIPSAVAGGHTATPPEKVVVVVHAGDLQTLTGQGHAGVLAADAESAALLVDRWGLQRGDLLLRTEVLATPTGEPVLLVDELPSLRLVLADELQNLVLVRCDEVQRITITAAGRVGHVAPLVIADGNVYWVDTGDLEDLLRRLDAELRLNLGNDGMAALLRQVHGQAVQARRARVLEARDVPEKLLAAVDTQALRATLPRGTLAAVARQGGDITDGTVARTALAVHGVGILRLLHAELEAGGLEPPREWTGGRAARRFVQELGFPPEYAGFPASRRRARLEVLGPATLPPAHAYQRQVMDRIRALLRSATDRRALLSLPTGAGKTRVAVEAIIEELKERGPRGPVLWVAQSDELCEQAVQTWSFVWRAVGPPEPLAISRLWDSNEASAEPDGHQVVIASVQKLQGCVGDGAYEWLSAASCVVVDEAHTSTAASYTRVLDWLGLGRSQGKDRCCLLGLTATPFRGTSRTETERLAARYGNQRLDHDVFVGEPYTELQRMGVLATVRHELLRGRRMRLTKGQLTQLRSLRSLPKEVEDEIGADHDRNQAILTSIRSLPSDWTVLLFAASVEHAQTLAALLELVGIRSAAISAGTDPALRQHYIEEFRHGRVRVLTNYGVLTQGFDSPRVRAVYVARPTFSPNVYQQMIGRGLRGRLNSGSDECLIVNVDDTFAQFGEELAFNRFEYLWTRR